MFWIDKSAGASLHNRKNEIHVIRSQSTTKKASWSCRLHSCAVSLISFFCLRRTFSYFFLSFPFSSDADKQNWSDPVHRHRIATAKKKNWKLNIITESNKRHQRDNSSVTRRGALRSFFFRRHCRLSSRSRSRDVSVKRWRQTPDDDDRSNPSRIHNRSVWRNHYCQRGKDEDGQDLSSVSAADQSDVLVRPL